MAKPGPRAVAGLGLRAGAALGGSALLLVLTGIMVAGLALSGAPQSSVALSGRPPLALGVGLLLALAGIESLRRRHFWLVVVISSGWALANAIAALQRGAGASAVQAAVFAAVAGIIVWYRGQFTRRAGAHRP